MRGRRKPDWAVWSRLRHRDLSSGLESWLRDSGSLTARLKRATQGDFRVRVVNQGWAKPFDSERRLLDMRRDSLALVREVELICLGTPWVFARTLIPVESLSGPTRRLTKLGTRPLGELLFADPHMRRGITQIARLRPGHRLYARATGGRGDERVIWGRRTLFHLSGKPLLVNEIFLPELPVDQL